MAMLVSGPGIQLCRPLHIINAFRSYIKTYQDISRHIKPLNESILYYDTLSFLIHQLLSFNIFQLNLIPVIFCSSLRFLRSACRCGWGQSDWHAALFRGSTCSAACIIIDRTREEKWDHGKGPGILERYNLNHWWGSSYSISLPKLIQCVSRVFRALQEQGFA